MNMVILMGVMVGTPVIRKEDGTRYIYFKIGTTNEYTGEGVYVNVKSKLNTGVNIASRMIEGTPLCLRGFLEYNKVRNANYVYATFIELLYNTFDKQVQMGLQEFLDIYKPSEVLKELKKLEKEQIKEAKACNQQSLDTAQSSQAQSNTKL